MNKFPRIDFLIETARAAGREILEVYHSGDFQAGSKADNSPLTAADLRSNAVICSMLHERHPEIPVLSEETAAVPFAERKNWQRYFLVDPLDGTKEFLKRNGEFTVNIALVEAGIPVAGVVAVPVTGEIYAADSSGAFYQDSAGTRTALHAGAHYSKLERVRVVGSRSHLTPEVEAFVQSLRDGGKTVDFVSMGSSLKLCMVAANRADVYPRFGPTMEWDTAAAHAVALAAGRSVLRYPEQSPLLYNKEDLLNPWFVVE